MTHPEYNKKAFLLPDSILSMSSYHAKIDNDGIAKLTIHDCRSSIQLWNNLNNPEEVQEMINKLRVLGKAALGFANFIEDNYSNQSPALVLSELVIL